MVLLIRLVVVVFFCSGLALVSYEARIEASESIMVAKADSEEYFYRELGLSVDQVSGYVEKVFSLRESDWKAAVQESAKLFLLLERSLSLLEQGLLKDRRAYSISSKIPDWRRLLMQLQVAVERDLTGKFERRLEESDEFLIRQATAQEMLSRFREIVLVAFVSVYAEDWPRDLYLRYQGQFNEMSTNSLVKIRSYIEGSHFMCRILFLDLTRGSP